MQKKVLHAYSGVDIRKRGWEILGGPPFSRAWRGRLEHLPAMADVGGAAGSQLGSFCFERERGPSAAIDVVIYLPVGSNIRSSGYVSYSDGSLSRGAYRLILRALYCLQLCADGVHQLGRLGVILGKSAGSPRRLTALSAGAGDLKEHLVAGP